jgi:hypothetical protein
MYSLRPTGPYANPALTSRYLRRHVAVCLQVICLHNAFLSAALQRCLLTETNMVRHIGVLLQAAHALAKEVAGLNDNSTGAWQLQSTGASETA